MQPTADIAAILRDSRIRADEGAVPEKINFELESLEALNVSEEKHFWPRIRQSLVTSLIGRFSRIPCRFLDVGCGNGSLLKHVETTYPGSTAAGMDGYLEALVNCRRRNPTSHLFLQDITKSPWMETGERYDAVAYMDVLEHLDHPEIALKETAKILNPDGIVIVSVPARHELWSDRDVFLGHRQRYDHRDLRALMEKSGFEVIHLNYLFTYLYLPMWLYRKILARVFSIPDGKVERNELVVIPGFNGLIRLLGALEIWLASFLPIPFGSSVYCVAEKKV